MNAPMIAVKFPSIYTLQGKKVNLPERMARCTPDTYKAMQGIGKELKKLQGELVLSDLFRSYDMQLQSNKDFLMKKKKAFSPPPGGSLHEAGRAFDMDLKAIKTTLKIFWEVADKLGVKPIIPKPVSGVSESWHFDCAGSHRLVYDYYAAGKGNNMNAYTAMAASAILSIGVNVDQFKENQQQAFIQSGLIRLGFNIGNIDGSIGKLSKAGLTKLSIGVTDMKAAAKAISNTLKEKFPGEYEVPAGMNVVKLV